MYNHSCHQLTKLWLYCFPGAGLHPISIVGFCQKQMKTPFMEIYCVSAKRSVEGNKDSDNPTYQDWCWSTWQGVHLMKNKWYVKLSASRDILAAHQVLNRRCVKIFVNSSLFLRQIGTRAFTKDRHQLFNKYNATIESQNCSTSAPS